MSGNYLNCRNCPSYRYLRSVGNNWKFDINKVHPKLVARLYKRFDTFDLNGDGVMDMDELLLWPERVKEFTNPTDQEMERMRACIMRFFEDLGCEIEGGLKREDWVEGNQVLAEAEFERIKRNQPTMVKLLGNSYFDVLDQDGSGEVTLPELKQMMKVFQIPIEAAYTFFEMADTDKSGALDRDEMADVFTKFWLEEYNPAYDGIYAYKY